MDCEILLVVHEKLENVHVSLFPKALLSSIAPTQINTLFKLFG